MSMSQKWLLVRLRLGLMARAQGSHNQWWGGSVRFGEDGKANGLGRFGLISKETPRQLENLASCFVFSDELPSIMSSNSSIDNDTLVVSSMVQGSKRSIWL